MAKHPYILYGKTSFASKIQREAATTWVRGGVGWGWKRVPPPSHKYRTARVAFHEEG